VRLDNVARVLDRTLTALDNNPQTVERLLTTVDRTVGPSATSQTPRCSRAASCRKQSERSDVRSKT
jgi:hypothetical protein